MRPIILRLSLVASVLTVISPAPRPCPAQIIDHRNVDGVAALPQATMDAIGLQKWFFAHASVGSNMLSGLSDLHSANPTRYKLQISSVGYNSGEMRAANPPSPTVAGRVYECPRGNPGWNDKFTIFVNSVNVSGWHETAVNAAMDKLCYIDQNANAVVYTNTMAALEAAYPTTAFIYTTMPLMTGEDGDNILRNQYNAAVRAYCSAHGGLLFDIADMEAHDPAGNPITFTSGGQTYQKLYSGYTSDGGHLNTPGRQRIAQGWYAVAAILTPGEDCNLNGIADAVDIGLGFSVDTDGDGVPDECEGQCDLNCDGLRNGADIQPFVQALLDSAGYAVSYPECERMNADCDGNGTVEAADVPAFVSTLLGT